MEEQQVIKVDPHISSQLIFDKPIWWRQVWMSIMEKVRLNFHLIIYKILCNLSYLKTWTCPHISLPCIKRATRDGARKVTYRPHVWLWGCTAQDLFQLSSWLSEHPVQRHILHQKEWRQMRPKIIMVALPCSYIQPRNHSLMKENIGIPVSIFSPWC
jgi:hypothetical protein